MEFNVCWSINALTTSWQPAIVAKCNAGLERVDTDIIQQIGNPSTGPWALIDPSPTL